MMPFTVAVLVSAGAAILVCTVIGPWLIREYEATLAWRRRLEARKQAALRWGINLLPEDQPDACKDGKDLNKQRLPDTHEDRDARC